MNREWSEQNKRIQQLLKREETFDEGVRETLSLRDTLMAEMLFWREKLEQEDYYAIPFVNANGYHSKTMAYSLWHIFRIEDIVAHTLIGKDEEVLFTGAYQTKTGSPIITTGNELVREEISAFSAQLSVEALYEYIQAVKHTTDAWLKGLRYTDLKTAFGESDRDRIREKKVVSTDENASWLIDYWTGKDIRGLIQMPFTRHWIMHTEAALRIIQKIKG